MLGLTGLGYVYGRSGRHEEARLILRQLVEGAERNDVSAYHAARVFAALGDVPQAFVWLRKAQRARDERMVMVQVDPKLSPLRPDPLFVELLEDLGLANPDRTARISGLPVLLAGP
jgi:hypothetical protein